MFRLETFSDYYLFIEFIGSVAVFVLTWVIIGLVVGVQRVSDAYTSWRNLNAEMAYEEWDAAQDALDPTTEPRSFANPNRTIEMLKCPRCRLRPSLFTFPGSEQITMTCDCEGVVVAANAHPTELERAWNNAVADRWDGIDATNPPYSY